MITAFNKLNIYYKTAFLSLVVGAVLSLVLMFLFFVGQSEIILGLIIGIFFGIIIYMINGLIDRTKNNKLLIGFIFTRLLLLIGFMFGMSFLYYQGGVHTFNVIAIAGGYLLVELIFILLHVRYRDGTR